MDANRNTAHIYTQYGYKQKYSTHTHTMWMQTETETNLLDKAGLP